MTIYTHFEVIATGHALRCSLGATGNVTVLALIGRIVTPVTLMACGDATLAASYGGN